MRKIRLYFCVSAFFILHSAFLSAQVPSWWFTRGAVDTNLPAKDYDLITLGQLKWLSTNACAEMDSYFGAGPGVKAVVNAFANSNNYYLANIGQLKYVAQPFYDRLYQLNLTNTFPADMPGYYPWGDVSQTNDFALANIGQAKYVFSFDSAVDSDADGLSDWDEVTRGTNPYHADTDGDGISDGVEVAQGTDPLRIDDPETLRKLEEARQRIVYHHRLYYGSTPAFTNLPGSVADLLDVNKALNALSGKFYKVE